MPTQNSHKRSNGIIPDWVVMTMILLATTAIAVTVLFRTSGKESDAKAQFEKTREDYRSRVLRAASNIPPQSTSPQEPQAVPSPFLEPFKMVLCCLVGLIGGYLTVSSVIGIRAELRSRRAEKLRWREYQQTLYDSLPFSARLLNHRQLLNVPVRNSHLGQATLQQSDAPVLLRLGLLLFCGMVLSGGFILAATQHFAAVQYGYKNESLRRLLVDDGSLKRSLVNVDEYLDPVVSTAATSTSLWVLLSLLILFAGVGSLLAVLPQFLKSRLRSPDIANAPGSRYLQWADFLYSPRTVEQVFKPLVADWRFEHFQALAQGKKYKAWWINVRYNYYLAMAMGLRNVTALVRVIVRR